MRYCLHSTTHNHSWSIKQSRTDFGCLIKCTHLHNHPSYSRLIYYIYQTVFYRLYFNSYPNIYCRKSKDCNVIFFSLYQAALIMCNNNMLLPVHRYFHYLDISPVALGCLAHRFRFWLLAMSVKIRIVGLSEVSAAWAACRAPDWTSTFLAPLHQCAWYSSGRIKML